MDTSRKNTIYLLRAGLAFSFLYPALSAFIDPASWIGYVPPWVEPVMSREVFLLVFSPIEIVVALGIIFWESVVPSLVAGLMLITIVVSNYNEFSVVFRDLSIACMAFALALLTRTK